MKYASSLYKNWATLDLATSKMVSKSDQFEVGNVRYENKYTKRSINTLLHLVYLFL